MAVESGPLQVRHSWLFLRGLARSKEHWGIFIDVFKKRFPQDEMELLDTAGNGSEYHRKSFLQISDYAEDLRVRSSLARNQKRLHLVCLSLGGMIGASWAAEHPEDLASLTLINVSDSSMAHLYERLQIHNYPRLVRTALFEKDRKKREKEILQMTAQTLTNPDHWAEIFAQTQETPVLNSLRQLWAASRFRFEKQKPPLSVQILVGMKDLFVDPVCSHRLAAQWRLDCIECMQGAHDLPLTEPQWVCDQLEKLRVST